MDAQALNQAADTLQREAKRQEQLAQAAKIIGDVGTLFSRVAEAEKVLADKRGALHDAETSLAETNHAVAVAKAQAVDIIKEANQQSEQIIAGAQAQVEQIASEAQATADKTLADANAAVEKIKAGWEQSFEQANGTLERIKAETVAAETARDSVNAQLADARAKLDEAKAALERITASVKGE